MEQGQVRDFDIGHEVRDRVEGLTEALAVAFDSGVGVEFEVAVAMLVAAEAEVVVGVL